MDLSVFGLVTSSMPLQFLAAFVLQLSLQYIRLLFLEGLGEVKENERLLGLFTPVKVSVLSLLCTRIHRYLRVTYVQARWQAKANARLITCQ